MRAASNSDIPLNADHLQVSTDILRALAHPLRLHMIRTLLDQQPLNVHTLYTLLNIEQSVASQHLRILRNAGLVYTQRKGKYVEYLVQSEQLNKALSVAARLLLPPSDSAEG
ncbi:MAG: helix-turn-helix transcriptional regulator [Saprospiraceae bacterium]|nr:helix-turn-helix transcriptional regulator [Saprospiraceae bacterium]